MAQVGFGFRASPAGIAHDEITVGTTAVQGPDVQIALGQTVVLYAAPENSGNIAIGEDNTVTMETGFVLSPGTTLQLAIRNLNMLWFIADSPNQKVRYICEID